MMTSSLFGSVSGSVVVALALASAALSFVAVLGQHCPSPRFMECGTNCEIPDDVNSGYFSYGVDGHYVLSAFSDDGTGVSPHIRATYTANLGKPQSSVANYKCWVSGDTGFQKKNGQVWELMWNVENPIDVWDDFLDSNYSTMEAISNGMHVYRPFSGKSYACHGDYFGRNLKADGSQWNAVDFVCNRGNQATVPNSLAVIPWNDGGWEVCASAGGVCSGLPSNVGQWIRFGDQGVFWYLYVLTTDGQWTCDWTLLGDPDYMPMNMPPFNYYCWRAKVEYVTYQFSAIVGQWQQKQSCFECANVKYALTTGMTSSTSQSTGTDFAWSLGVSITAGMDFNMFGVGASLSATVSTDVSRSVSTSVSSSMSQTVTQGISFTCAKSYLYQWTVEATASAGIGDTDQKYRIDSEDYLCVDAPNPRCPPGYCEPFTNCQWCISTPWSANGATYALPGPDITAPADANEKKNNHYFDKYVLTQPWAQSMATFVAGAISTLLLLFVTRKLVCCGGCGCFRHGHGSATLNKKRYTHETGITFDEYENVRLESASASASASGLDDADV